MGGGGATRRERPLLVTVGSIVGAVSASVVMLFLADREPEWTVIGLPGRHDRIGLTERKADCIDCHVPFVGTPGSRCLGPGCHGELATGTPPRDGKAMPIRFHAVLRAEECSRCHQEHTDAPGAWTRIFTHDIVPEGERQRCSRCHSADGVKSHARTDAVSCDLCHSFDSFKGSKMEHGRVASQPCDLCHVSPETKSHASIAGTCTDCHTTNDWTPQR
jgi:hypothetical protein